MDFEKTLKQQLDQFAQEYIQQIKQQIYDDHRRMTHYQASQMIEGDAYEAFMGLFSMVKESLGEYCPEAPHIYSDPLNRYSYYSEIENALKKLVSENKQMKAKLAELEAKASEQD